jgi:SAM-dependent methyltransferase
MASIKENVSAWNGWYDWPQAGDEWSLAWGNSFMQWYETLLPRIAWVSPKASILEIACGFGRWTQFLLGNCDQLVAVDISQKCIDACRKRFENSGKASFFLNDGKSLEMIADSSIDFVFSYDSLVHADKDAIQGYLSQLPRILRSDGVAFIHHSNLFEYSNSFEMRIRSKHRVARLLEKIGAIERDLKWRDKSVDAAFVYDCCRSHGLACIGQETVKWNTRRVFTDCMSTIVKADGKYARPNRLFRNEFFMEEMNNAKRLSRIYSNEVTKSVPSGTVQ